MECARWRADGAGGGYPQNGTGGPRIGLFSAVEIGRRYLSPRLPRFLASGAIFVESLADSFSQLPADLLGSLSWREAGVLFSQNLGFPTPGFQGGFEVVEGFEQVAADGVAG